MFKKIFVVLAMMGVMIPSFAFAAYGLEDASQGTGLIKAGQPINAQEEIPDLIGTIVGVVLSLLGVVFFLLILYAGIMWMTAFGVADKAEKSKEILIQASVGLIIVLAAYAISSFVFSRLGAGVNTTNNEGYCSDAGGTCKATCADAESVWATPYECAPQSCCVPD